MFRIVRIIVLSASTFSAAAAHAGEVAKLAEEAETLITKGDGPAAYDKMRQSLAAASDSIPFDIRKAFFVSEKPLMFGSYDRVANNEFPTGTSLITYAEPIGLAWIPDGSGVTSAFTVDFELRNPAGELLAEQKGTLAISLCADGIPGGDQAHCVVGQHPGGFACLRVFHHFPTERVGSALRDTREL